MSTVKEYKVFYLHNGKGQPLICQHTAGCHNHQWRGLLEDDEITDRYNVIAYDLPQPRQVRSAAQYGVVEGRLQADGGALLQFHRQAVRCAWS